jgi:hypothetical protein
MPKMVALDSATLGRVSRDYWSQDASLRDKARSFITGLRRLGVFVTFTGHHVMEVLQHGDEEVFRQRLKFLRNIPLIAWLRPYERNWFPGGVADLFLHEIDAVVHGSARKWREIVDEVRADLWETGTGSEMFVEDEKSWTIVRQGFNRLHEKQKYVASMGRADAAQCKDVKISEALALPLRPKGEREAYMHWFTQELERQLDQHGDKRFNYSHEAAVDFAAATLEDITVIDGMDGNLIQRLAECAAVPYECVSPQMTIEELGELGVYASRLKTFSMYLRPPRSLTISDIPPNTLPSYVLERRLVSVQRRAERVSGSDFGDSCIAPLVLYADAIEVDKRTHEFLRQMRRDEPELAPLMKRVFPSSDYSQIPEFLSD